MIARWAAPAVAAAGVAGLVLCSVLWPVFTLRGWTLALVAWSGVPLGSLVLVLAGALTGGRWRDAQAPVIIPSARLSPLVLLGLLPPLAGLGLLFPWANGGTGAAGDVVHYYLNDTGLAARTTVALGGLAVLSVVASVRSPPLLAGLGLAFAAVALSAFAVDWVLSLDPGVASSAFPATLVMQQVLTALAACALLRPDALAERDRADLAGLLIAAMLGVFYLGLMAYIVAWYGNLPDKAGWYLRRSGHGWGALLAAAFVLGVLGPFLLLLFGRARRSVAALRFAGASVLAGVVLHTAWLMGPAFGWGSLAPGSFALALLAGLTLPLGTAGLRREHAHA